MQTRESDRRPGIRFLPFVPFLFLGIVFVGGHGTLTIFLSLVASVVLTAGISLAVTRYRARRRRRRVTYEEDGSELR